jgi:hypothetical protein
MAHDEKKSTAVESTEAATAKAASPTQAPQQTTTSVSSDDHDDQSVRITRATASRKVQSLGPVAFPIQLQCS